MTRPLLLLSLLTLLLGACGTTYANRAELPPTFAKALADVEGYYLAEATRNAAFLARCSEGETTSQILGTRGSTVYLQTDASDAAWVKDGKVDTIGVEACGQRLIYLVVCGPWESYSGMLRENAEPCHVVSDSSSASQQTNP